MKNFVSTIKRYASKAKKGITAAMIAGAAVAYSTGASAAEPDMSVVTTSITAKFTEIVTAALLVLGSVAAAGLILFGGIYAWRYGKKVFSVVAK
jgi:hypothetical protein